MLTLPAIIPVPKPYVEIWSWGFTIGLIGLVFLVWWWRTRK